jgi:hypothetical protein
VIFWMKIDWIICKYIKLPKKKKKNNIVNDDNYTMMKKINIFIMNEKKNKKLNIWMDE